MTLATRFIVGAISAAVYLGLIDPLPSFAQGPAPTVTITGLVDFVTSAYKNWSQAAGVAGGVPGQPDPTNAKEKGWYSRERGVFTLVGTVGRVRGVWAAEMNFTNGAGNFNASSQPGSLTTVGVPFGAGSNLDLDTDVQGAIQTKWLYLEAPITGPGSLMPFIPVTTLGRFGAQSFRGHGYKYGILASGDFPGVSLETIWGPELSSTLTFVQIGEALDRFIAPNQKDQIAVILSAEADLFKGLTILSTYAYAFYDGGNCGTSSLGTPAVGGYNPNTNCPPVTSGSVATPGGVGRNIERHYLGVDVMWRVGPVYIQPTFLYLLGQQEVANRSGVVNTVDVRSFLLDTSVGFRTGSLNVESRIAYTPGVGANHDVQNGGGGVIRTYQQINSGFGYMAGWTEIWTGGVDYALSFLVPRSGLTLRESPSYDKFGRIFWGAAADYSLTPALTLKLLTNLSWTDTSVDTKGTYLAGITPSGITSAVPGNPFKGGKERYLGNEWITGLIYRFAPNVVFDLAGAYLNAGAALNINHLHAKDVYKLSSRLRVTF